GGAQGLGPHQGRESQIDRVVAPPHPNPPPPGGREQTAPGGREPDRGRGPALAGRTFDRRIDSGALSWFFLIRSLVWGVPLVAVLVLPWCWWVNQTTGGGFVQEFL